MVTFLNVSVIFYYELFIGTFTLISSYFSDVKYLAVKIVGLNLRRQSFRDHTLLA